jgi:hypothetical protein
MLFLHGRESRYDRPPDQVEAAARRYAEERGYAFEAIKVSGDNRFEQEQRARERIAKGGIAAIYGFSAGGYTADRIERDYPNIKYIKVGAPGTAGDIELPGIDHMDLPEALADGAANLARLK